MISLIGTSHLDLDGYDRLKILLDHSKPSVIGIEETREDFEETSNLVRSLSNPQIFEQALRNAQRQFPNANPDTLRLWLSSANYETRAISEYLTSKNIQIIYCDDPKELVKVDFEEQARKSKSPLNQGIEKFLRLSPGEARLNISQEYSQTEYPVKDCAELVDFYQARDQFTEQILRAQKGKVVYVCGLDHIFGDYHPNLFDRLSDINPKRIKLSEADRL
ncbi:MAG: hypothetical protein IIA87_05540 [Nanoarchaeota archaeon]|nr:hypothetical protein [Nanoarchaeota archaeon]